MYLFVSSYPVKYSRWDQKGTKVAYTLSVQSEKMLIIYQAI